jgi:RHS repeat-associated protein
MEALARDAARRARAEWFDSLRTRGLVVHEDPESGHIRIEDAARGWAIVEPQPEGIAVRSSETGPSGEERRYHFQYNADRQIRTVTDPAGLRVVFDYDERKRLSVIHRGSYSRFIFVYDCADNLVGIQYPDNSLARMNYDESGRLVETVDRNGHSRQFEYARIGLPERIIGLKGEVTSYEYDSRGELNAVVSPLEHRQIYEDHTENATTILRLEDGHTKKPREILNVSVNRESGRREFSYPDGTFARFDYSAGQLTAASNGECTVNLKYDAHGGVIAEETTFAGEPQTKVVQYERNVLGSIDAIITPAPGSERIVFERDSEHRLRKVWDAQDKVWEIGYELSGALASIRYPNGVVVTRESTAFGYPESLSVKSPDSTSLIPDTAWTYDACDRVASQTSAAASHTFQYDREGRLIQVENSRTGAIDEYWSLDANGNREIDRRVQCTYNALDQLELLGSNQFRYDPQGNMIEGVSPRGHIRCKYNGRGQLVEASIAQQVTHYAYDPFGRRISKQEPGRLTRYTWAGQWLLSEVVEENGRTTRRDYLVVPDLGVPVAQRVQGWNYYLHHGRRFEPLAMTDDNGRVVWKATYDAFGVASIETSRVSLALRLPGQYFDNETGLHYNLARYYDPRLGRFVQRDPLGYGGGCWNEYIYCGGDPLNRSDPAGEFLWILAGAAIGAAIGGGIEAYREHKAHPNAPRDWGKIGKEALIGGAVGALGVGVGMALAPAVGALGSGLAASISGAALAGGTASAVQTCASDVLHAHLPTPAGVLGSFEQGAAIGAVTGGLGGLWAGRASQAAQEVEEVEGELAPATSGKAVEDPSRPACGEPVDGVTGEVLMWKTDFVVPGAMELALKRSYSSGLPYSSCFGPRWTSTWSQWVEPSEGAATFYGADGRWVKFDLSPSDTKEWIAHPDVAKIRLRRSSAEFEVRDESRRTLRFARRLGKRWLLTSIQDANGYSIRFTYDDAGALRQVEHSGGYRLGVEGTPTQIRRVTLLTNDSAPVELVRYEYDQAGRLTKVIDGSGLPFLYRYDDEARVTRWEDRNGTWYEYQYDARGRCRKAFGPEGMYSYQFEYDERSRTNIVTNSLGAATTFVYNELQQTVMRRDALGNTTYTAWDRQSNKLQERDEEGRDFHQEYDSDGNVTQVRDGLGHTTRIAYNPLGLPEILTDAAGQVWKRRYDERGNLVEAQGPDGAAWRYERDEAGNVVRMIDPGGNIRRFGYDERGLLLWSTDAKGNRVTLAHDGLGRLAERTDQLGRRTRFRYNSLGKLAEAILADGAHLRWEYDAGGNLVRRIGPDGKAYSYRYGRFDLLQEMVKPSGGKLKLSYDSEARLTAVQNELRQVWRYEYNPAGQVVRERDFHGRLQEFSYDGSGLCVGRTNGLGEEILLERDKAGQLVAQRGAEESSYEYDVLGRVRLAAKEGVEVSLERDAYGRVLRELQDGHVVESSYDARGLRVKRATARQQCEWSWDANGQVSGLKLAGDELLEFVHDAAGREVERRMRGGLVVRQGYDAMDRLTKQWAGLAAAGAVALGVVDRDFRYDANGDPVEIRDAHWGTSRFAYEADGRIARAERERGPAEEFTYDLAGNIAADRNGLNGAAPVGPQLTAGLKMRYYGKDGRLERIGETRYDWDADGRLGERREGQQRWRYEWTPEGHLRNVQTPGGQRWKYEYDAFGRRVKKIGPDGTTRYVWDGEAIAEEIHEGGTATDWVYEPGSFRPLLKQDEGKICQCITDQVGTPRELLTRDGTVTWSAFLTTWGEVGETAKGTADCPIRFQGQWFDAESGLHYNFHRYYDPETGQYLSPDPIGLNGGTRLYGYVHNPLMWVDPLGLVSPPDEYIVVRGGQGPMPEPGAVFSGSHGPTIEEAAKGVPHGTVRSTTVGAIKAGGGTVEIAPEPAYPGGPLNEQHVNITEGAGESTFSEPIPNPVPKPQRIQGRPKC